MGKGRKFTLVKHLSQRQLENIYKKEKDFRKKERLQFILGLYDGHRLKDTSKMIRRSESTCKRWLKSWNKYGLEGLMPSFSDSGKGGGNPYLENEDWDHIFIELKDKGMSIEDVRKHVNAKYKISYSYKGVWERLRRKKNGVRLAHYGKPYKVHANRHDDAEFILKKTSKKPV